MRNDPRYFMLIVISFFAGVGVGKSFFDDPGWVATTALIVFVLCGIYLGSVAEEAEKKDV